MRHLFLPACLCLMTLPGPTGKAPRLPLDDFTGVTRVNKDDAEQPQPLPQTTAELEAEAAPTDDGASDTPTAADGEQHVPGDIVPTPMPPIRKPVVARSRTEICTTLTAAAQANDVPVPFFIRLIFQESRFEPGVVSSAGAEGIAQFMPETSAQVGLDNPFDPLQAIPAAARLLSALAHEFGNLGLAAAAYNAGPKRIADWLARKGPLPQETQGYVKTITGRAPESWTATVNGSPALKLPRHAPCQDAAGLLAWNGPDHIPLPPAPGGRKSPAAVAHTAAPHKTPVQVAAKTPAAAAKSADKAAKTVVAAKAADKAPHAESAAAAHLAASKHKHGPRREKIAQN